MTELLGFRRRNQIGSCKPYCSLRMMVRLGMLLAVVVPHRYARKTEGTFCRALYHVTRVVSNQGESIFKAIWLLVVCLCAQVL
jgi:hypothetical protein